jgi:hypothetical protein
MSEWLSIKDERLKDNTPLLFTDGEKVYYGVHFTGRWLQGDILGSRVKGVTNWMSLPEPPMCGRPLE